MTYPSMNVILSRFKIWKWLAIMPLGLIAIFIFSLLYLIEFSLRLLADCVKYINLGSKDSPMFMKKTLKWVKK